MTTQELLKKAHEIASSFFKVSSISVSIRHDFEQNFDGISITLFFFLGTKKDNLTVHLWDSDSVKGIDGLLLKFKHQCEIEKMQQDGLPSEIILEVMEKFNTEQ